ncbi:MAG: adenosylmethionine--8-amino-7-oxononanoate transaminase, partial [Lentisphaeria bacterium]|nr:adenosylmethionine--8-amino-7-oxononanoate transaminase [Lentisphaeria bacterium]
MNFETDRRHLWHPYAPIVEPPPVNGAVSASGTRIRLADGTELVDGVSSWWCAAHGHNHPEILRAIREQSEKLSHVMFAGFTHEPATTLAQELIRKLPAGLDAIFLADSGSIAVECAAKMAVQYQFARGKSGKSQLAALKGGYHGDTIGAMALSDPGGMHTMFREILPRHHFAEQPRCRFDGAWDDADFVSMRELLDRYADELAAVIVEPVFQGANAMNFYHPEYLRRLRRCCDEHDVLLIFDEVATGFGRTGKLFAMDHAGVTPDIVCLGKILSGGMITLACAVASRQVAETISENGRGAMLHGPTFMANPLACAAATASLKLLDRYDWQVKVGRIETELREQLAPAREFPHVRDVRALGAVGVIEVDRLPSPARVREVVRASGALFAAGGIVHV